ncbi:hypothetical protein E3T28_09255 [Cryobacterium sinapicolor]|uniref:Double-GTPase 1 domain-containing protein n=1 Tax=Cryobacterium sinapicolor TaxID=1259236 RepID=A0ABY2J3H3_9MICO|nr:hypothetical protein [Cryobacterium sinapicolor]TFC99409.1 hypothetical protein E3T28_09255 [Cryobacterium sinapicolor]
MTEFSPRAILVGFPHAGKSTYLALLFLAILRGERCSIQLANHRDDREHANFLMSALLNCKEATRTEVSQKKGLRLSIRHRSGEEGLLAVPDLSGETWQDVIETGTMDADLFDDVRYSRSAALFIHVGDFAHDPLIADVNAGADALGDADPRESAAPEPYTPTQVDVAELLQVLDETAGPECEISVVLSAFDLAEGITPADWLTDNAPLVAQYLRSARPRRTIRLYGLSAQGGSFDTDRDQLSDRDGLDRAIMTDSDGVDAAIDEPILGLLRR